MHAHMYVDVAAIITGGVHTPEPDTLALDAGGHLFFQAKWAYTTDKLLSALPGGSGSPASSQNQRAGSIGIANKGIPLLSGHKQVCSVMLLHTATRLIAGSASGRAPRVVMSDRWRMSPGLRRTSAVVAIAALAIGGAKVASDHTMPGSGFSTVATVAADPSGPTGGPGGPDGMNGGAFQPPGLPPQQPGYQGGINQPPLDQNSGISIYNTGSPGAQQVPGQQGAQQPQQGWDQPAHGTQPPNYSTAPGYTQGPGKPNPDFQAPQQQAPQQNTPQQPQQQQPEQQSQQPSQAPTQTQQPQQPKQEDDLQQQMNQRQLKCDSATSILGVPRIVLSLAQGAGSIIGGIVQPSRYGPGDGGDCSCLDDQGLGSAKSEVTDYGVYQRFDINNMQDMIKMHDNQATMVKADKACATATQTLPIPLPFSLVTDGVSYACTLSALLYDQPVVDSITRAIALNKCITLTSYAGGLWWSANPKECG